MLPALWFGALCRPCHLRHVSPTCRRRHHQGFRRGPAGALDRHALTQRKVSRTPNQMPTLQSGMSAVPQ